MESVFLAAVDAAVAQALPADWPRVPHHRLPGCGGTRARHAFRRRGGTGPGSYMAIVAAPSAESHTAARDGEMAALVELVLARGAGLLLLYEAGAARADWIVDRLGFPHPRLLALACIPSGIEGSTAGEPEPFCVEPTWLGREALSRTIRDLWSGGLFYDGPLEGPQTVGVEILRDVCWRCCRTLGTVTGIVFPDREVADWSLPDWAYYQQLAELALLPDPVAAALSAAVDSWRGEGETVLTPIRWRYGNTVANSCWAAECPTCGAFRGAVPVLAERQPRLASLGPRRTGALRYRPLLLDVPRRLLHDLAWSCEITPHARPLGWRRAADPRRAPDGDATSDRPLDPCRHAGDDSSSAIAPVAPASPAHPPRPAIPAHRSWRRLGQALAAWLNPRRST
jgi:hypothetical protein